MFGAHEHRASDRKAKPQYIDFWNAYSSPNSTPGGTSSPAVSTAQRKGVPGAALQRGDTVLDVGCGWGDTAIEIARRVGPAGSVAGCRLLRARSSTPAARTRSDSPLTNLTFVEADVQTYPFRRSYDFCFSRFGTQFFENPVAGLRNMRSRSDRADS